MIFWLIVGAAVVAALVAGVVYDRRYPGVRIKGRGPRYSASRYRGLGTSEQSGHPVERIAADEEP